MQEAAVKRLPSRRGHERHDGLYFARPCNHPVYYHADLEHNYQQSKPERLRRTPSATVEASFRPVNNRVPGALATQNSRFVVGDIAALDIHHILPHRWL